MSQKPLSSELVEIVDRVLAEDEASQYKRLSALVRLKLIQIRDHFDVSETLATQLPLKVPNTSGPNEVTLTLKQGIMLPVSSEERFRAAVLPVLEDATTGPVTYHGFTQGGGYLNIHFSGMCPIHKRYHDGGAWKWVLKQKKNGDHAGWKCWRDNAFFKFTSIPELEYI